MPRYLRVDFFWLEESIFYLFQNYYWVIVNIYISLNYKMIKVYMYINKVVNFKF
jgi:hypothetical protein